MASGPQHYKEAERLLAGSPLSDADREDGIGPMSPEASSDEEYRDWAYEAGAHIDLTGAVVWPGDRGHPDTVRQEGEF